MQHRPPQPHRTDLGRSCDQIGEVRAARQTDLVDPEQLPAFLGQRGVDEGYTSRHDAFPLHQTRTLHLHGECGEFLCEPLLDAGSYLLAKAARADGAGGHHAGHRDR